MLYFACFKLQHMSSPSLKMDAELTGLLMRRTKWCMKYLTAVKARKKEKESHAMLDDTWKALFAGFKSRKQTVSAAFHSCGFERTHSLHFSPKWVRISTRRKYPALRRAL